MAIQITAKNSHLLPGEIQALLKNIGKNIQLSRKRREMSQADLAKAMFVTRQTVSRLENGEPSIAMATLLLAVFCLQREKELLGLLAPENDKLGMFLDTQRQEKRKAIKRRKRDDLDF